MKEIADLLEAGRDVYSGFRSRNVSKSVGKQSYEPTDDLPKEDLPNPDPLEMEIGQEVFPFSDSESLIKEELTAFNTAYKTSHTREAKLNFVAADGHKLILNIDVSLLPWADVEGTDIVPFNPLQGYQLDDDDYDPHLRMQKIIEFRKQGENVAAPLALSLFVSVDELLEVGLLEPRLEGSTFLQMTENGQNFIENIRCTINANDTNYESAQDVALVPETKDQSLIFDEFYLKDSGPFPKIKDEQGYDWLDYYPGDGHGLRFSTDPKELAQIGLRFDIRDGNA